LGGIGIFVSFFLSLFIGALMSGTLHGLQWGILAGSGLVFLIGLYDDFRPMSPSAKLAGQILAATIIISLGYTSTFFNPRISNSVVAQLPNILLTYIWLVGITNATNLLDNMDGLAGGISLITAAFLGYFFWKAGNQGLLWVCLALSGSVLGFLFFNFPPASIFMGDSGSLFLGFTLAVLAIAQQQQASNVFAVLGVPTLLFLLPILDTALVTFTRLLRGQSPAHGGRDHTSHRLIAFGLSERQVLLVLYGVALFSGILAAGLEAINYWLSLVLAPFLIVILALIAAYLGGVKVVESADAARQERPIARLMLELTYRRRILEVILDFFLIAMTYYLAFLTRYGRGMDEALLDLYLRSLPFALAAGYLSFFAFGVYRGVWRYVSVNDLLRYLQAALGSAVLLAASVFLLDSSGLATWANIYSHMIILLFAIFLFLGLAASRSSFKLLDLISHQRAREDGQRVLIYGAGEMALRWILMNPGLSYRPIGFLDDNSLMMGRKIHGVEVLGGPEQLEAILKRYRIEGVILAGIQDSGENKLLAICNQNNCWVRSLRLEFEQIEVNSK
jgi:UDP-GlcNAc:undecaprenyl-phosphate GlcNAc-1-phosphate transferase